MPSLDGTPPKIGSSVWYEELRQMRVKQNAVEESLRTVLDASVDQEFDPHEVDIEGEAALKAAVWFLLHQRFPNYGTMMNMGLDVWHDADIPLRQWITRQYAACLIHGSEEERESASYRLWVDHFECEDEAEEVFPVLMRNLPEEHWGNLLVVSGPVPWHLKYPYLEQASNKETLHADLAKGLVGSLYDVYGQVDVPSALQLFRRIVVADDKVRQVLEKALTGPQTAIAERVEVNPAKLDMPLYGFGLEQHDIKDEHLNVFFVKARYSDKPRLIVDSELMSSGASFGEVKHFNLTPELGAEEVRLWLTVKGSPERAHSLVGQEIELWPPGLKEYLSSIGKHGVR